MEKIEIFSAEVPLSFMHSKILATLPIIALILGSCSKKEESLKITGSTTINIPVAEAAETLRADSDLKIFIDTQGGSSGGITAIGGGSADIAMASKPITQKDRDRFPGVELVVTEIGADAVALVVSAEVWNAGVQSLTAEQVRSLYEKKITNWKYLGGPDLPVVYYNKEPGRGTWEVFANYAYGNAKLAPEVSHPEVGANEEARTKVSTTPGGITQLSVAWADHQTCFPLGLKTATGEVIEASGANIASGKYQMSRPLNLITRGAPAGKAKIMVDYMLSEPGQRLMEKSGYLPVAKLK